VARWRELGDPSETAAALDALGWLLFYDDDDVAASLAAFEEELAIWLELGDEAGEIRARGGVCQGLVALGEVERAEQLSRELLERVQGDLRVQHFAIHYLADCALIRGDCDEAEGLYRESLRLALELGDVIETSIEVQGVAMTKAGRGEAPGALELAASVEALWRSLGVDLHVAFWDELLERYLGAARAALGPEESDAARGRGLGLPFDDAVALALGATTGG
jgi:tetratricopeptide (TPR) repeat protein